MVIARFLGVLVVRIGLVLALGLAAASAQAASPTRLQEHCRVAAPTNTPLWSALERLDRCLTPASRHHNGTIFVEYRRFPLWLEPGRTFRLAIDNHRVRGVDVWLVSGKGQVQRYSYDPNAPDREWAAGNYLSLLFTPGFEVERMIFRLADGQTHTFVRPPLIARAKIFAPVERNRAALYGIAVGMLALTILFHLSLFFAIRRRFQLIYCTHIALLLLYGLGYSGIIRLVAPTLTATGVSNLLSFTMVAATGTGIAFLVEFLGLALKPWLRRWALAGAAASLIVAPLLVIAPDALAHTANLLGNLIAAHAILLAAGILILASWRRHPLAGVVSLGWALPITISLMYPARTLGLIPPGSIPDGLLMLATTVECLILSLPVTSRIRRLRLDHERAQERHVMLERQAQTDSLTGLANRRGFGEALTRADEAHAEPGTLGLLLIDIDHFKRVNDQFGHATGDAILRHVAMHVAKVAGPGAIVGRHGGEEFVVALRSYDLARAATIAERIRVSIGATFDDAPDLPRVTVSIGVAAGTSDSLDDLLDDADCALYRAKHEGRNRVMLADGPLVYAASTYAAAA